MIFRVPAKKTSRKRKSRKPATRFQKKLAELLDQAGLSVSQDFENRSIEKRWKIPKSTLEDLLFKDVDPRFKTLEGVAHTLGINPLSLMRLLLDDPPEEAEQDFQLSPLAAAWNLYRQLDSADQSEKDRINRSIARLVEDMQEIIKGR